MDNPIPYLQLFVILQCLLVIAYLSVNRRFSLRQNQMLGCLIGVLALHMVLNLLSTDLFQNIAKPLSIGFGMCYGPILYFYTRSLTFQDFHLARRHLVHGFAPITVAIISSISDILVLWFALGIFLSLLYYNLRIWRHLKEYRMILQQTRSEFSDISLSWLSQLLALQWAILLINIASVSLHELGHQSLASIADILLFCALLGLVNLVIFQGMQQPQIFTGLSEEDKQYAANEQHSDLLSQAEMEGILDKIQQHMERARPYLHCGLTVKALGRQLSIVPRQISQTINQCAGCNFSEFVNQYRINHACALLRSEEGKTLNIMDVMLESGFATKSTFNRAFKLQTGQTPYDYRQTVHPPTN